MKAWSISFCSMGVFQKELFMMVTAHENVPGKKQQGPVISRIKSNFLWTALNELAGKGIFFFTNIYLARTLGVESYGLFTIALVVTSYFWLAVDMGLNMYGIRELSRNKDNVDKLLNPLLTMRVITALSVFTIFSVVISLWDMGQSEKATYLGCGLYLMTYSVYTDWVFKGLEKFKYISFGNIIASVFFLVATFLLVKGPDNVAYAAFSWSASYLAGAIVLGYLLYSKVGFRFRPDFDLGVWASHLKKSLYFTASGSFMLLYQYLPIFLIGYIFSNYEVGLFAAPYRIVTTICHTGFMIAMASYPVMSDLFKSDNDAFRSSHLKLVKIMLVLGCAAGGIGMFFSRDAVLLLLGEKYLNSIILFKFLIWLVPIYFIRYVFGTALFSSGGQKAHFISSICGTVVTATVGWMLIKNYGATGAAVTALVAELVVLAVMAFSFELLMRKNEAI